MTIGELAAQFKVCCILKINHTRYTDMQYESGLLFLQENFSHDPDRHTFWVTSNSFWESWKKYWNIRNLEFVNDLRERGLLDIMLRTSRKHKCLLKEVHDNYRGYLNLNKIQIVIQ